MFSFFKSFFKSVKSAGQDKNPNGPIINTFIPRNLDRISIEEFELQKRQSMERIVIDLSVKGNHDCMSCGENVAYYRLGPIEKCGNWPAYHSLRVECECGHGNEDIVDDTYTQEEIENTVRYVWNELNDFETRLKELQHYD